MARDRRNGPHTLDELRVLFEPHRPGGWWRRDLLLIALDAAYPHWLTARQIHDLCCILRPSYRRPRGIGSVDRTARSLGRLHSYRQVDRYGDRGGWQKYDPVARKVTRNAGYRYRLIRDAEDLI